MSSKINKRLSDLEAQTGAKIGTVVLYCDLDQEGVYWDQPFSGKDRLRYTEKEKQEFEQRHDLIVVKYVKNWRSVS